MKDINQLKIEKEFGYLKINGKYFILDDRDGKTIFSEIKKKDIQERMNKAKKIAKKMKDGLDKEAVLMESLLKLTNKELNKLDDMLFKSKRKYKPTTRKHHCVDMKVGKFIVPIVD